MFSVNRDRYVDSDLLCLRAFKSVQRRATFREATSITHVVT